RHITFQVLADGLKAAINEALLHVDEDDTVSTFGKNMSNAVAHGPGADYSYCLDAHKCLDWDSLLAYSLGFAVEWETSLSWGKSCYCYGEALGGPNSGRSKLRWCEYKPPFCYFIVAVERHL